MKHSFTLVTKALFLFSLINTPQLSHAVTTGSRVTTVDGDSKSHTQTPYVAQGITGSTKRQGTNDYNVSVSFKINESGANSSTLTAYYKKTSLDSWSSVTSSNPTGTSGSGASASDGTSYATLTGLECGNNYEYYLYANNAASGTTSGITRTISAITCNTGASYKAQSAPNATEDQAYTWKAYTWTPTKTNGSGANDYVYSFKVRPTVTGGYTLNVPRIDSSSGQISWTPTEGNTLASFTIQVTDSWADTHVTDTLPVTITAKAQIDEDPVITTVSIADGTEDIFNYSFSFAATDADTVDTKSWSITAASDTDMSITTEGLFTWNPLEGDEGAHYVSIQIEDSGGLTDSQVYNFIINPDNENPVITTSTASQVTNEDSPYSLDLYASDGDFNSGNVASHKWSITNPLSGQAVDDGLAIDGATGVLTWIPSTEANLTQAVSVLVTDGLGGTDSTNFDIVVTAIDDNNPNITTTSMPDATEEVAYREILTFSDADIDGDSWTWSIASGPTVQPGGTSPTNTFSINSATGEVTWTPAKNETSLDFTARITDSDGDFSDQALSINVSATNDTPE
jgi:hypothetical protein